MPSSTLEEGSGIGVKEKYAAPLSPPLPGVTKVSINAPDVPLNLRTLLLKKPLT